MAKQTQSQQQEPDKPSQSYISRVRLKGYKSIIDTEVTFKPGLNIIIGANGSGKTNFVEFLEELFQGESVSFDYVASINYYYKGKESSYKVEGIIERQKETKRLINKIKETLKILDKVVIEDDEYKDFSEMKSRADWNSLIPNKIGFQIPDDFSNLQNIREFSIDKITEAKDKDSNTLFKLEEPEYFSYPTPYITESLLKLLEVSLAKLLTDKDLYQIGQHYDIHLPEELISALKKFSPIKNLSVSSSYDIELSENKIKVQNLKFEFLVNDKWLTWNQLSDGTKRMFYIITEITFANNVILLEEPELGIHPHQLIRLMDFIKEQSETKQIILTTHSPEVLNTLKMNELDQIIVARYDKEKGTQMSHLSDDDMEYARSYMKDELFLSDYWVMSGFETEGEEV